MAMTGMPVSRFRVSYWKMDCTPFGYVTVTRLLELRRAGRPAQGIAVSEPPPSPQRFLGAARHELRGETRRDLLHRGGERFGEEHAAPDGGWNPATYLRYGHHWRARLGASGT